MLFGLDRYQYSVLGIGRYQRYLCGIGIGDTEADTSADTADAWRLCNESIHPLMTPGTNRKWSNTVGAFEQSAH